jgi:hypothetical protein
VLAVAAAPTEDVLTGCTLNRYRKKMSRLHMSAGVYESYTSSPAAYTRLALICTPATSIASAASKAGSSVVAAVQSQVPSPQQLLRYTACAGNVVNYTPYIIHHTSYTIHHTPHTMHHTPYIIHHTPYTMPHAPYIIHHTPYTMHHTPYTIHHAPYTMHSLYLQQPLPLPMIQHLD